MDLLPPIRPEGHGSSLEKVKQSQLKSNQFKSNNLVLRTLTSCKLAVVLLALAAPGHEVKETAEQKQPLKRSCGAIPLPGLSASRTKNHRKTICQVPPPCQSLQLCSQRCHLRPQLRAASAASASERQKSMIQLYHTIPKSCRNYSILAMLSQSHVSER